jgi:hypothetical protein
MEELKLAYYKEQISKLVDASDDVELLTLIYTLLMRAKLNNNKDMT